MYKVLIVDDDEIVRAGLKRFIDWEGMGFHIIETAESGEKALEVVKSQPVDVVLTDIVMSPDMNGIELIKQINQISNEIMTVILSGHDEFAFAKEALKLGARDYLCKPVVFDELTAIFKEIFKDLKKRENERSHKSDLLKTAKDSFLFNLVKGDYIESSYIDKCINEFDLQLPQRDGYMIRVHMVNKDVLLSTKQKEIAITGLNSKANELIGTYMKKYGDFEKLNYAYNEIVMLFYPKDEKWHSILNDLMMLLIKKLTVNIYISISNVFQDIRCVNEAFQQSEVAMTYKILYNNSKIIFFNNISLNRTGSMKITDDMKQKLIEKVKLGDEKAIFNCVDSLMDEVCSIQNINIDAVYNTYNNILLIISNYVMDNLDGINKIDTSSMIARNNLYQLESIDEVSVKLHKRIQELLRMVEDISDNSQGRIIDQAKLYINEHYNEEISLNMLSEILYVHPIYLSKLFKEKTGQNFIDYLTKLRIDKSKKFLKDLSYKIYEISDLIGYESPKYFSKVFKAYEGVTPKEYRNNVR